MRVLITGGKGMLGRTLCSRWERHSLYVADLPEVDILDPAALLDACEAFRPDVMIHCAAMTRVDDCEARRDLAFSLNETGSRHVALAARQCGAWLYGISTDYVFRGTADRPYAESDEPDPLTVYGASKWAGERAIAEVLPSRHTIVRIAWLYGAGGPSFVHTMLRLGREEGAAPLRVVDDQVGNPTSAAAVADLLDWLMAHPLVGIVHGSCEGEASWFGFAQEIFRLAKLPRGLIPCTTADFPRPAPRPANSRLAKVRLAQAGYRMPEWRSALNAFLKEEGSV